MRFANIKMQREGRITVGDDIQLLALENLYRYMGIDSSDIIRIPYNQLATYDGEYVILPISFPMYGFSRDAIITGYSDRIIPVFLGAATLTNEYCGQDVEYLKRFGPIGCRDEYTMKIMRAHGIPSYLNGCMTMTFERQRNGADGRAHIYCVDIEESLKSFIPEDMLPDCVFVSHVYMTDEFQSNSEDKARSVYQNYIDDAKLVITSRLHAALPCMAFGIPVIFARERFSHRFPFVENLIPVYSKDQFSAINWQPITVDCEREKSLMLDCAANRLRETWRTFEATLAISELYERRNYNERLDIDGFTNTVEYIKNTFDPAESFEYTLWGVHQTAQMLCCYITEYYPHAKLLGIIDSYKHIEFCGVRTTGKEIMEGQPKTTCFVCAPAIMPAAKEYFNSIDHNKVYYCWSDGLVR